MFNKKNKNIASSQSYTPPHSSQLAATQSEVQSAFATEDFTKSYVPEDEGSGHMLGYLSIIFGFLFNIIGMVLGVLSIYRGIQRKNVVLSILGAVGIIAGILSVFMYIQAFQLLLPGVAYDTDTKEWVIREDDPAKPEIILEEYSVLSPKGERFDVSLPGGLELMSSGDNAEHDFFVTELNLTEALGDFRSTALFFNQFDEELTVADIRSITNEVILQDKTGIEEASFGLLRDTHRGIVPDTIQITNPTHRTDLDHSYFDELLMFEVSFDRLIDRQVLPTAAVVWLLYDTTQVVLVSISAPQQSNVELRDLSFDIVESFGPYSRSIR